MNQPETLILVLSTIETASQAEQLARKLVADSLAACVQIDGPIQSHYLWQGELHSDNEYRLSIKSAMKVWPKLKTALAELHPYDEPQILMMPITDASAGYRDWVLENTRS